MKSPLDRAIEESEAEAEKIRNEMNALYWKYLKSLNRFQVNDLYKQKYGFELPPKR